MRVVVAVVVVAVVVVAVVVVVVPNRWDIVVNSEDGITIIWLGNVYTPRKTTVTVIFGCVHMYITNMLYIYVPIPSMYGIFIYIWLFLMVKYGKCR